MQINVWQVASGLGVGAFFGLLFLSVVKHFGRKKGEGFQTSQLGKEATAIIATLIVVIFGGITLTAIVMYSPGRQSTKQLIRDSNESLSDSENAVRKTISDLYINNPWQYPDKSGELQKYFSPDLAKMLIAESKHDTLDGAALDFDPFYDSQDPYPNGHVSDSFMIGAPTFRMNNVVVPVYLNAGEGKHRELKYSLNKFDNKWLITNVSYQRRKETLVEILTYPKS